MKSDAERCAEHEKFKKIDAAFRAGDLAALRAAVDDPASVPNGPMPLTIGSCLEYAIYHSPLPFIRTLLEIGADPSPAGHAGFPPLIAAVSCRRPRPDHLDGRTCWRSCNCCSPSSPTPINAVSTTTHPCTWL